MPCIDRQTKGVFFRVYVCKWENTDENIKEIIAMQYRTVNKVVIYKSVDFVDQQEPPTSIQTRNRCRCYGVYSVHQVLKRILMLLPR